MSGAGPARVVPLTPARRVWLGTLDATWPAHTVYGLLEVDVTRARRRLAEHRARTGEALSFTAFLVHCLARALDEDRSVQAYRKGRKALVVFDDVSVGLLVERASGGKAGLVGHVVRAANRKTYRDIHEEIRAAQTGPLPSGRGMPAWFRTGMLLPWPLSSLFRALLRLAGRLDPRIVVAMAGTVQATSVGMFGGGHAGWAVTPTPQPVGLTAGGIAWQPLVVHGRVEPREVLHLTLAFDHDVVDGGPAARFTRRLVDLIERADALDGLAEAGQPTSGASTSANVARPEQSA